MAKRKKKRAWKEVPPSKKHSALPDRKEAAIPSQVPVPTVKRFGIRGWKLVGVIAVLLGLASNFHRFLPSVSIYPYASLDDTNFFSQQLRITNDGLLPIHVLSVGAEDLQASWGMHITRSPAYAMFPTPKNVPFKAFTLSRGESNTVNMEEFKWKNIRQAEVTIVVSYYHGWWPIGLEKRKRFIIRQDAKGSFHWLDVRSKAN
jgi:hypothetical protein